MCTILRNPQRYRPIKKDLRGVCLAFLRRISRDTVEQNVPSVQYVIWLLSSKYANLPWILIASFVDLLQNAFSSVIKRRICFFKKKFTILFLRCFYCIGICVHMFIYAFDNKLTQISQITYFFQIPVDFLLLAFSQT